jgi:CHAT domain-containing protein
VSLAIALAGSMWSETAESLSCTAALGPSAVSSGPLKTLGTQPVTVELALQSGHSYLIDVDEKGNDLLVEVLDSKNGVMARADHPERRTGTRRSIVTAPLGSDTAVRLTGKEHANAAGMATVRAFDLAAVATRPDCDAIFKSLAAADSDYAAGKEISSGHSAAPSGTAHAALVRAARAYLSAEHALAASGDHALRGQTALALAGLQYLDLQDWQKAADWAQTAAKVFGTSDPYRRARAEALAAAAWIEMGWNGTDSSQLLRRARKALRRLAHFHLERGERYDAGLQITNIGLTYLYEGRFDECIASFATSSRLFDSLHEIPRRAQAWQNRALCLSSLGRLPEALQWFERALADIGPEPYPTLYVAALTNTALTSYELGRFDESLRLYDRALGFTQKTQLQRDEAYCLFGIGLNYYALGDPERARDFLERSLAIRTVAVDPRGRMGSLRALATLQAEQGSLDRALTLDREALSLAVAPVNIEGITIQLAKHTAAAGHPEEARVMLTDVLTRTDDPLIKARALVQRAVVVRQLGRPHETLADLSAARRSLQGLGRVTEEFELELELARTLRSVGQSHAALASIERALRQSDALRLQTANPEFRSQLQKPLRSAYDLKIELLRARYEDAVNSGRAEEAEKLARRAFASADLSRARFFADVAAQKYPADFRRAFAAEFRQREALYRELAARRFALETHAERAGSQDPQARRLMSDIAELERRVDSVNTVIASRSSPQDESGGTAARRMSLPVLPADTVLVSYWLGLESAYAWVVSPTAIHWARLPAPAGIADKAARFHHSLTRLVDTPIERRLEEARDLYQLIVQPIEPYLAAARQWVLIPDGALHYVPFAALRIPGAKSDSFVVLQHDLALTPAAWMLETSGSAAELHHPRGLLLVADPVYQSDDPRLAAIKSAAATAPSLDQGLLNARRDYRRLPFTAREAAAISAQFPPALVDRLIGLDATRERLLSMDWSQYRYIHIATHGIVDAQVPQLSAVILGSYDARGNAVDGAVRVSDLGLQTLTADVAVFSACETALGHEVPSEGLVGISSTMLARGARAVVASLWTVSDEIGARLMTEFYRHLLHDSTRAPAALGAAMRSVLSRDAAVDPALWAAYQIYVATLGSGQPEPTTWEDHNRDETVAPHPAALPGREAARGARLASIPSAQGLLPDP